MQFEETCFAGSPQPLRLDRAWRFRRARLAILLQPEFACFIQGGAVVHAVFKDCQQRCALEFVACGILPQQLRIFDQIAATGYEELRRRVGLGIAVQFGAQARQRESGGVVGALGESPPLGAARDKREQGLARIGQADRRQHPRERLRRCAFGRMPECCRQALPGLALQHAGFLHQGRAMRDKAARGGGAGGAGRTHGRQAYQSQEPAVKGVDRDRRHGGQQALMQHARAWQRGRGLGIVEPALPQECTSRARLGHRKICQPGLEPRAHFLRCLAGEGQRENRSRFGAGQQQPQHARGQQPCLAAAGAGLHHA